jgi:twitching motility protein PilT
LRSLRDKPLSGLDVRDMVYTLLDRTHRQSFERDLELDFSLSVSPAIRFRVNVHSQRGNVEASFRQIAPAVRTFEELHLPDQFRQFADYREGLVLVTGPTGAGKTTAAAAMIEHINRTRTAVIITMENPIEYVYTYQRSIIKQREIGVDTLSYPTALKEAMRQDPDVIFIGEVRDEETMMAAMDAAQTGHLVIATFSAATCIQSIHRVYQFFTKTQQRELQMELAACLMGIVCLRLLPRLDGAGMIPATEIMVNTPAVANQIRKGSMEQITSIIQAGASFGMHSLSVSLERLVKAGTVSAQAAQLALKGQES